MMDGTYRPSPEIKLLVLCSVCGHPLDLADLKAECELDRIDWSGLVETASRHKVANVLAYSSKRAGLFALMPIKVRLQLESLLIHSLGMHNRQMREAVEISRHLLDRRFSIAFLKGVVLTQTTYQKDPAARPFGDLDILVSEDQSDEILNVFTSELGYSCKDDDQRVQTLYKELVQHLVPLRKGGVFAIDLHHRLNQRYDSYRVNTQRILQNADHLSYGDGTIPVTSLEDTIITLCLHLYQHEYRELGYRLKHHMDIANTLLQYRDRVNWNELLGYVREDGLEFPVTYGLYHTDLVYREILGIDIVPKDFLAEIAPRDFEKRKNGMTHRHLHTDEVFGYWDTDYGFWNKRNETWSGHYFERLFGDENITKLRFFYTYFRTVSESRLQGLCQELGFEFRQDYYRI